MWTYILDFIKRIFGIRRTTTSNSQQEENQRNAEEYADIKDINFTDIFAKQLATQALSDSSAEIPSDSVRADLLNTVMSDVWAKSKKFVSMMLGVGGVALVPYVANGKLRFDVVTQDRVIFNTKDGDRILNATVLADELTVGNTKYYRFVNYAVEGNVLHITNKSVSDTGSIADVQEWRDIPDVSIANVDRVLFGFIKSPVDNRLCSDDYGVPITYGCKSIIDEIKECLMQYKEEFKLKEVRVQVDEHFFDKDPKTGKPILKDKLFIAGYSQDGSLFNVFDPAIRDNSYRMRLQDLFSLLEKSIGTSKGILTEPNSTYENTEAIRRSVGATFAIITDIRNCFEKGLEDFFYACDVLANYYNLSPAGEYSISYDWSYAMIESTTETWAQMKELHAAGGISLAELRAWQTGEDLETAEEKVAEIKAKEPSLTSLLGMETDTAPIASSKSSQKQIEQTIDDTVTKTLNGAQTQSLINIVMQHKQGVLTEGQAINIISTAIGVSKEQATELLRA